MAQDPQIQPPNSSQLLRNKLGSPNVCFLFGAGASKSVGYPLMSELSALARERLCVGDPLLEILSSLSGQTIEDQLGELYGQLRSPSLSRIPQEALKASIDHMLDVIHEECVRQAPIDAHRAFVKGAVERVSDRKRVHVFTTNYDMLFEWACDAERIICVNGFFGLQQRTFDAGQFDLRPARVVQRSRPFGGRGVAFHPYIPLYKLHGSVSWTTDGVTIHETIVRPGARRAPGQLMVFPTPQKTNETWKSPYSELHSRMGQVLAVRQTSLITLGFSFGDAYFASLIEKCLSDNTFILVVLSKNMHPGFDIFIPHRNATIITETVTVVEGKEYQTSSDLWSFPCFVNLYVGS